MKKYIILLINIVIFGNAFSQPASSGTSTDLSVPISPAFSITDITPTLIQNPITPKSFALGVAQSVQQSAYAANFAPVWWIDPAGINVYSYLGLPQPKKGTSTSRVEKPFSGIKFTTISLAFINKNLIPDNTTTQNILSIGVHSTLFKLHAWNYAGRLADQIDLWETEALKELNANIPYQTALTRLQIAVNNNLSDPTYISKKNALDKTYKEGKTPDVFKNVNKILSEKPVFAVDVAAAWAVYGINNNQSVNTGRVGAWGSISSFIPLNDDKTNYFALNLLSRFLLDNYQKNDNGVVGMAKNKDFGGNIGFDFNRLSIGVESLYRFTNGVANTQNRTVGVINVKITDAVFINGTFGKDFPGPNKLISAFGLNWGFGKEQVSLPVL